ncbi:MULTISPECIES: preprotein translocase subunit SecG [unclassified Clostridium]|jgi:preprotein translocase, secG subunit|uniref:preprotein translocase subunit SecG n=1 Tax=unclassified Clostridium TaxID=2614128 RepID=UPI0025FEF2D0|nr:preprotein translocase subunit SecG [Clostridium sp.]MDY2629918.1 preprotein translocase subunit SecG [Clostridium sp.]MDY4253273.1 preprotein translocase subunit SecG [Clostridium sp.]MDY6228234.1 preprotein translocase subunit SecG [Clostridium sp.]
MKNLLLVLEAILGLVIIISVLLQPSKTDALSGLIQGSKNETFFSKNKARTKEAMLLKVTIISMALFAVNTLALNLI